MIVLSSAYMNLTSVSDKTTAAEVAAFTDKQCKLVI